MLKIYSFIKVLAVTAFVCIGSMIAEAKTLYLHSASAADVSVELGEIQSITIGDQDVTILLSDNSTVVCAIADFKSISTTESHNVEQSAVTSITAAAGEKWQVYDLKGNMLGTADNIANGGKLSSVLAPGVYVVKSKSQTLKLIVR